MDCRPLGSSVHGIPQARILEWVAISFSGGFSSPRDQTLISCIGRRILYQWATWEAQEYVYVYEYVLVQSSRSVMFNSLGPHGLQHARSSCPSPFPELTQTHVHWVSDGIQPSHSLSSPPPPPFNLPQNQGLFKWVSFEGAVLRWQRNRMGKPLSPPKLIKITFERWVNSTKQCHPKMNWSHTAHNTAWESPRYIFNPVPLKI